MRLCAEGLFAVNALIDAGLFVCSARLCGERLRWKRIALAGGLGGVYTVAALMPGLGFLRCGLLKLCAAAGLCLVAFGESTRLFRLTAAFCAAGCAFAGVVTAFTQLTGTGLLRVPGGGFYPVSAWALLSIGALCMALCRIFFSACAQHTSREFTSIELRLGENSVKLRALVDTGNTLKDPMTNEPVLVLDWKTLGQMIPDVAFQEQDFLSPPDLMRKLTKQKPFLRLRLIPYRSVGVSHGMLLAVRCERKRENGKFTPALAAFSPTPVSAGGEYEALTGGAA